MRVSIRWFPIVGLLSLLGTGAAAPALARDSVNTFGMAGFPSSFAHSHGTTIYADSNVMPHIGARSFNIQNDLQFRRHAQLQNGPRITIWPYWSFVGTTPIDTPPIQSELAPIPPVIVMPGLPNGVPEPQAPEAPLDYGYVEGCRAIPNGYHCDTPHNATVAP
jgi:hypothetical protein